MFPTKNCVCFLLDMILKNPVDGALVLIQVKMFYENIRRDVNNKKTQLIKPNSNVTFIRKNTSTRIHYIKGFMQTLKLMWN